MSSSAGTAAPQRRLLQGSLWKMKTSMTGGIKWKKKWVSSDGVVVAHWHSDVLPKKNTPPKHTYVLEKCQLIEFKASRPYAFKLVDKRSKEEIVFACDNITEYAQWLSFLTDDKSSNQVNDVDDANPMELSHTRSSDKQRLRHARDDDGYLSETISGYNEMAATTEDKVTDFFHSRNTRFDKDVSIRSTDFWDLMKTIEERISITMGRQAISLLTKKPGIIYMKDFFHWWQNRHSIDNKNTQSSDTSNLLRSHIGLSSSKRGGENKKKSDIGIFGSSVPDNLLHYVGVLDTELTQTPAAAGAQSAAELLHTSAFVKQKLPNVKNILTEWEVGNAAGQSWNDRIQSSVEAVLQAQNAIYEDTNGENRQGPSALLEAYFHHFAMKGSFYTAAKTGVQTIVDEYSLPNHMQTAERVQLTDEGLDEDGTSGPVTADIESEEVFILNGLVYRMIAVPSSQRDLDQNSSDVYMRYITGTDMVKHKIGGNDQRAYVAVQRAVFAWDEEQVGNIRPCAIMQTIVDYGGYRVQVFAPVYLEERRTLKYGQSSLEDIFICQDIPEPDSGGEYVYRKIFQQLAERLNVRHRVIRTVVSDQLGTDDIDNVHVYESSELMLTKEMQFHLSDDDRFYLINFNNLMPPDIPQPDSNDVLTKQFRPEFVAKFQLSLSPEALTIENAPIDDAVGQDIDENGATNESVNHRVSFEDHKDTPADRGRKQSVIQQNLAKMQVESIVMASKKLKTLTAFELVKMLDYMVVLPLDSYSLTKFLHANGVNIRHLGLMYNYSRIFHVRQILLCEAVARTVKVLLKQVLQRCTRRGKAECLMAEERGRSKEAHFVDYQQSLMLSKRRAVVDMFNLVLGAGPKCDEFWTGLLPSAVLQKFNLNLPKNINRSTILHGFQLFEAMKYHCSVKFRDSNSYIFHQPSVPEPFLLDDLIVYSPAVKADHLYPGCDHDLNALSAAYMKEHLYSDAMNILRIHLSAVVLSQGTHVVENFLSPKQQSITSHLTYEIALCHYMLKQYDLCSTVLLAQLESTEKYSVMAGRMLTLLMSSTFLSGSGSSAVKVNTSLQYFESGKTMFYLTLGSQTPMIGVHVSALADLYFSSKAFTQAKITNMIAHTSFQHALGDMHPVCAGVACKLGNLLIAEMQYAAAVEMLEGAFAVYQHINKQTMGAVGEAKENIHVYHTEEAQCLHALAVALRGKSEVTYAMQCAVLSVDIATADNRPITRSTTHTLLILAEMYETTSDLYTAVALYQDVWSIVKSNPHVFPMSTILVDLAGRMVRVIVDMLPLQSKTLLETILAETERPSAMDWELVVNMVIAELWTQDPVPYIRDTIKLALERAGEKGMFSLASRLDYIVKSKASTGVIGVPFCIVEEAPAQNTIKTIISPTTAASPTLSVSDSPSPSPSRKVAMKRASSEMDYAQRKSEFLARSSSARSLLAGEGFLGTNGSVPPRSSVSFQNVPDIHVQNEESSGPENVESDPSAGLEFALNLKLIALYKLSASARK